MFGLGLLRRLFHKYIWKPKYKEKISKKERILFSVFDRAFAQIKTEFPELESTLLRHNPSLYRTKDKKGFFYGFTGSCDQPFQFYFHQEGKRSPNITLMCIVPEKLPPHQWVKEGYPENTFFVETNEGEFKYTKVDEIYFSCARPKEKDPELKGHVAIACHFLQQALKKAIPLREAYTARDAFQKSLMENLQIETDDGKSLQPTQSLRSFVLAKGGDENTPPEFWIAFMDPYRSYFYGIKEKDILHSFPIKGADLTIETQKAIYALGTVTSEVLIKAKERFMDDHLVDMELNLADGAPVVALTHIVGGRGVLHFGLNFHARTPFTQAGKVAVYDLDHSFRNEDLPFDTPLCDQMLERVDFPECPNETTRTNIVHAFKTPPTSYENLFTAFHLQRHLDGKK